MSEPIRSKQGDISKAPTPQNTPASVTNLYLKSQPPTVSTISEGNEGEEKDDENKISKQLANNPALLSMIQGKLGNLVGQQSGYVDGLSKVVKKRVYGLKAIQQEQMKLEADFQKELLNLEKTFFKKYEPLYERRRKIINGNEEPSLEEIEEGEQLAEEDKEIEEEEEEEEEEGGEEQEGIPGFWFTALENLSTVREIITDRDSEVLEHLIDIRMEYLETPGFELIFEFDTKNPFFSNQILTKTYHYQAELGYSGDFVYDHADGCEINWKLKESNVTINIERRKQRNKTTKQTRTIEKLTPTESFFNFFDPPKPPKIKEEEQEEEAKEEDEEDEEDEDEDLEARLELDYQLGEEIKDRLIPRAVDWFTGDAVEFGYPDEFEGEEDEFDSEEEEEDDDDEAQDAAPKEAPAECKQQ
ncbi:NAP-domain-containing protein [Hyphopichia burtonii NRRL Y-1933]|uniref:NAP-domain-containing protein n=2 Tax=Dikarya TaxID=451864 RepID=A0A1E4RP31_9ASCO|nr:NAP-domain-containing protein [Hyphopichia burtonii NRRL Y-1933]ODV69030.1 NAP-domain-containing protein [Hyphopichia burtonii NRRL Y-1933]